MIDYKEIGKHGNDALFKVLLGIFAEMATILRSMDMQTTQEEQWNIIVNTLEISLKRAQEWRAGINVGDDCQS